jgi:hypothetical protein
VEFQQTIGSAIKERPTLDGIDFNVYPFSIGSVTFEAPRWKNICYCCISK